MSWPGGIPGHWHGFGPWVGSPARYAQEGGRRPPHPDPPGAESDHATRYREAAGEFATSSLPPLMTGHWLTKQGQAAPERTWSHATDALGWLKAQHTDNPPFQRSDGRQAYVSLEVKLAYAADVLPRGVDVTWVYYTQSRSLLSLSVVCCPNRFHPAVRCPLPPSRPSPPVRRTDVASPAAP